MKRCSFVTKDMQIKTMRYHFTLTKMAKILKLTIAIAGENAEYNKFYSLLVGMQSGTVTL